MSWFSKLAKIGASFIPGVGPIASDLIGAAGSALSGASEASANNRSAQLDAATQAEMLNQARRKQFVEESLAREADKRDSGKSAFREMQHASYVADGGHEYTPKAGLKSYGFGSKASSQAEKDAASNYLAEQTKRLSAQDSLLPAAVDPGNFAYDEKLLKGGKGEKIAGWLGAGLGAYSGLMNARDTKNMTDGQLTTIAAALKRLGVSPLTDEEEEE